MSAQRKWLRAEKLARIERLYHAGYNFAEIGVRVGHRRDVVRKVVLRGFKQKAHQHPPAPGDFLLYATVEKMTELQKRYNRGNPTIKRWLAEKGVKRPSMHRTNVERDCPPDFARRAVSMTIAEQCSTWKACRRTINRWRQECSLPTPRSDLIRARKAAAERAANIAQWRRPDSNNRSNS